jgi:hypothetical protein
VFAQSVGIVVHHDVPVVLDNVADGCDTFDGINIEDADLGKEDRRSILCYSTVYLGVLRVVHGLWASQSSCGVGIEARLLGSQLAFRSLFDHFHNIVKDEFACTEPPTEGINFTFLNTKAVNGISEGSPSHFNNISES